VGFTVSSAMMAPGGPPVAGSDEGGNGLLWPPWWKLQGRGPIGMGHLLFEVYPEDVFENQPVQGERV